MFKETKKSMQWGEETLTLETGKIARQADGSVIATLGETSVMANVTFAKEQKPGMDFFPLTVHYQEKYYAAGKVPGGFFKREARPTEKETLTARLIDRPIRPLFVPGFKHEVLVMCTVLSHDLVNDPVPKAFLSFPFFFHFLVDKINCFRQANYSGDVLRPAAQPVFVATTVE